MCHQWNKQQLHNGANFVISAARVKDFVISAARVKDFVISAARVKDFVISAARVKDTSEAVYKELNVDVQQ